MTRQELKEKFIEYFGEEKWCEEEMLADVFEFELYVCKHLNIDPIPIVIDEMDEDSRYYMEEDYIAISKKCIKDKLESCKCLAHEFRHKFQKYVIDNDIKDVTRERWEASYYNPYVVTDVNSPEQLIKYICSPVEMDAFAFQRFIVNKYFDTDIEIYGFEYTMFLDFYIMEYFE